MPTFANSATGPNNHIYNMAISFSSVLATATDPLLLAGAVVVAGFFGARYGQRRGPLTQFLVQLLVFVILTCLLLAGGVAPYRPGVTISSEPRRLIVGALEAIWWLGAAWLAVGFLRTFIVLGRQPRESKLVQDLLAALIYLAAIFAIIAEVFDLPIQGLLATSGALAIIIGLALQSSLGDVFSGIVLNIEGQLWSVVEFQHVKPGKGPAFVRTKLKNVLSGKVVDKTYNAGVKVETATVDRRDTT